MQRESEIKEKSLDLQVLEAYNEGKKSLEVGDVLFAAKKFNEAEILFPQSKWAPKAALMAAYSYYSQDYYGDAIAELERFFRVYPNHKNIDYAYYLIALSHYEQIIDETDPKIPKDYILSFSINDIVLLEFCKPEWKDGFKLDPPLTKRMR